MRVYKCDRCGEEIKKITHCSDLEFIKTKYTIEGHFWCRKVAEHDEDFEFQLCPKCSDELIK